MTKICDTCGGGIDSAHPFATCPKCLFGEALAPVVPEAIAPPSAAARETPGLHARPDFFQKYDLIQRVDGGGQGDIWEVWDSEFRRTLAMKRLARAETGSESVVSRFVAEAQIASQLEHPGILPIFDVGLDPDGRPYYTTQLLPRRNLEEVWRQVRERTGTEWTRRRALDLLLQICAVMAYAHARGVIHRDLKPSNILVGPYGEVRVIDWGSARLLGSTRLDGQPSPVATDRQEAMASPAGSAQSTASSGLPMTALFTPPEILQGQADAFGPETDVYSMGVMLYELLAGCPPYAEPGGELPPLDVLRQRIQAGPPVPVRQIRSSVPRDLAAICAKAMAHERTARYRSMEALAADLRAFQEVRPVQARNPGPFQRLHKLVLRNLSYIALLTLFLAGATVAYNVRRQLAAERDAARLRTCLADAQLAARSGRWPEAVRLWQEARRFPSHDPVDIGLRLAEGHIVLSDKPAARAELEALVGRPDLGERRGAVLLRLGEHEMFGRSTFTQGVARVREALAGGLTAADAALAEGLIADSTPVALGHFQAALRLDPYFHSAHRHSLGLEFILGRHADLASHLRIARALYPGDFSPGAIEVSELAVLGQRDQALAVLASYRDKAAPETLARLEGSVRFLANVSDAFDLEVYLGGRTNAVSSSMVLAEALQSMQRHRQDGGADGASVLLPQLPCVEQGLGEAFKAVSALSMISLFGGEARVEEAVQAIRASWKRHPEALLPVFAGHALEKLHPRQGPRHPRWLELQSEMYQLGADSPSILPNLTRLSLVHVLDVQSELAGSSITNAAFYRRAFVANAQRAVADTNLPPIACRALFKWAASLGEFDLARGFLLRWEAQAPDDPSLARNRVRLDLAAGALGSAHERLERMLAANANNAWALTQRQELVQRVAELSARLQGTTNSTAAPR